MFICPDLKDILQTHTYRKTLPLIENYFFLNKKYKKENAENPMVVHPFLVKIQRVKFIDLHLSVKSIKQRNPTSGFFSSVTSHVCLSIWPILIWIVKVVGVLAKIQISTTVLSCILYENMTLKELFYIHKRPWDTF